VAKFWNLKNVSELAVKMNWLPRFWDPCSNIFVYSALLHLTADQSASAGISLQPLDGWDRGFKSRCLAFVVRSVGSGLCDHLITVQRIPTGCVSVWVCVNYKPQQRGDLSVSWAAALQENKISADLLRNPGSTPQRSKRNLSFFKSADGLWGPFCLIPGVTLN
jgi:hypothetical protein